MRTQQIPCGSAEPSSPLVNYYLAYITKNARYLEKAESLKMGYCFPSNVEDIAVLRYAAEAGAKAANARVLSRMPLL